MKKANKALAALLALTMVTGSFWLAAEAVMAPARQRLHLLRKAQQRPQMLMHLQAARILWWHPAHILRENSLRSLQPAQKISISLI